MSSGLQFDEETSRKVELLYMTPDTLDGSTEGIARSPGSLFYHEYRFGPAVVWAYRDTDGTTQIRCFMPGTGLRKGGLCQKPKGSNFCVSFAS